MPQSERLPATLADMFAHVMAVTALLVIAACVFYVNKRPSDGSNLLLPGGARIVKSCPMTQTGRLRRLSCITQRCTDRPIYLVVLNVQTVDLAILMRHSKRIIGRFLEF